MLQYPYEKWRKKYLYIIAGANGSGKSTVASELLPIENINFLNKYKHLADKWNLFYNGSSEYILVAKNENDAVEIYNEALYNEFIKDLK